MKKFKTKLKNLSDSDFEFSHFYPFLNTLKTRLTALRVHLRGAFYCKKLRVWYNCKCGTYTYGNVLEIVELVYVLFRVRNGHRYLGQTDDLIAVCFCACVKIWVNIFLFCYHSFTSISFNTHCRVLISFKHIFTRT